MLSVMAALNGLPATTQDLERLALTNYGHFTSMRVGRTAACEGSRCTWPA